MAEAPIMSFELNEEMLQTVEREFSPEDIALRLTESVSGKSSEDVDKIGEEIFTKYGTDLMNRCYQLGEEYPDRTYEMIRQEAENTGSLAFPLIPQRFIEIAYLSIQHISTLPVLENNIRRLVFQIKDCKIYNQIKSKAGDDVAERLTCRHGCLKLCEGLFSQFGFDDVSVEMEASTNKEGYCEFVVTRK
jgi:hypothetical protein